MMRVAVALHKAAELPEDALYLPVQCGAALAPALGLARDDTGENISRRNPLYCELTAHYWLWKNADAEVLGLCHYRRYFSLRRRPRTLADALTARQLEALLADADVIVPRPRLYLIETNWSHYAHAHREGDLIALRAVMAEVFPAYLPAFDRVMKRRRGRRFNLCIMRRAYFERYSAWLFGTLFALEERLGADIPPRTMGYLAERLMDVWLEQERPRMRELAVLHTQGEHWPGKIARFLWRKMRGGG